MNSEVKIICIKTGKVLETVKPKSNFNYSWKKDMKTMFNNYSKADELYYQNDEEKEIINRVLKDAGVK